MQQPQNVTTSKRNDPKMRQLRNATTRKLPKKKGQERASSDFYDFFPERQLNLLVISLELSIDIAQQQQQQQQQQSAFIVFESMNYPFGSTPKKSMLSVDSAC